MRRPCVGRIGLGRSSGVAESRTNTVLSRTRVLMVAVIVALVSMPLTAHAQSTTDQIAKTRAEIDKIAQQWFQSQQDAKDLDTQIAELQQQVTVAESDANRTAIVARARALEIYKGSGSDFGPVLDSTDALDSVRRAELLDRANAQSQQAIDDYETASIDLTKKRQELEGRRSAQASVVDQLGSQRAALEQQLAGLRAQADREAAAAARAQQAAAAAAAKPSGSAPKAVAPSGARKPAAASAPKISVSPPPAPSGTNPHHDDPFLACTRARESRGNYGVVSGSGLYYGAYQFSPTTWNTTANHAGRLDLIGVLPSQASAYDQDEMAWTLYQWQGTGPWGGRC